MVVASCACSLSGKGEKRERLARFRLIPKYISFFFSVYIQMQSVSGSSQHDNCEHDILVVGMQKGVYFCHFHNTECRRN